MFPFRLLCSKCKNVFFLDLLMPESRLEKSMNLSNKSGRSSILHQGLCVDGPKKGELAALDPMVQDDCTVFMKSREFSEHLQRKLFKRKFQYVMLELAHNIRKRTLIDKSKCSRKSFPIGKFTQILDLDSIGSDQVLCPFWTRSSMVMLFRASEKLLLPTAIDSVDLELSSLFVNFFLKS